MVSDEILLANTEYLPEENNTVCLVVDDNVKCNTKFNGNGKFNVKRHIQNLHPFLLKNAKPIEKEKQFNLKIKISVRNVIQACIEAVTIDGRPLCSLNDKGFSRLFNTVSISINLLPI